MTGHPHSELRPTPAREIVPGDEIAVRSPETTEHEILTVLSAGAEGALLRLVTRTTYGEEHVLDVGRDERLDVVRVVPE